MSQSSPRISVEDPGAPVAVEIYEFGPFRVDVSRHVVTRHGQPLALSPKSFDLLLLLMRGRGRLVTRGELMTGLWPDTFVEETNLSFQLSTLRKALGNDGRWIETVPKHGYRCSAPIRRVGAAEAEGSGGSPQPPEAAATSRHVGAGPVARALPRWQRPVLLAATLAGVGWLLAAQWRSTDAARDRLGGAVAAHLTTLPGEEKVPSLSPDGSQVAFEWDGPHRDNFDIHVKLVGQGEPLRLTTDPAVDSNASWSPDGRWIAFMRGLTGRRPRVLVMPALGGTERVIETGDRVHLRGGGVTGAVRLLTWTPDGRWIVAGGEGPNREKGLWLIAVEGGDPRQLTRTPQPFLIDTAPAFSPDGRLVAFVREITKSINALYVLPLTADASPAGPPVELVDATPLGVIGLAWADTRTLVYSVAGHAAPSRTYRLSLTADGLAAAGGPTPLPFGEQATAIAVARSGRLVYASRFRDVNFWRIDLTRPDGGIRDVHAGRSTLEEATPDFSPDGGKVAFASSRSGTQEIWLMNADGSGLRQLTAFGGPNCANPQWSRDGTRILFTAAPRGTGGLFLLDPATARATRLDTGPGYVLEGKWSRDGQSIYFSRQTTETIPDANVWRMPAGGGAPVQLTQAGGIAAQESHDGRWLYFSRGGEIWRMPTGGGPEERVATGLVGVTNLVVGRTHLYFTAAGRSRSDTRIDAVDLRTGMQTTVAALGKPAGGGLALSPDERTLLVPLVDAEGSDLMVVEPTR